MVSSRLPSPLDSVANIIVEKFKKASTRDGERYRAGGGVERALVVAVGAIFRVLGQEEVSFGPHDDFHDGAQFLFVGSLRQMVKIFQDFLCHLAGGFQPGISFFHCPPPLSRFFDTIFIILPI